MTSLPTGMIDLNPDQLHIRQHIFSIAMKCFKARGAVQIETPVAELYSTVQIYMEMTLINLFTHWMILMLKKKVILFLNQRIN